MARHTYNLAESELPTHWYNISADLPTPQPPILGADGKPINPDLLDHILCPALIEQELTQQRWISIPETIRQIYRHWRPTPLIRASRLEDYLQTPVRIYYKYEGHSPSGTHKGNTAIAQAYFNLQAGAKKIVSETGGGQWGYALAHAGQLFDLEIEIYMTKAGMLARPDRKTLIQTLGAEIITSPSGKTKVSQNTSPEHLNSGSLLARSEALEIASNEPDTRYAASSLLNFVSIHQSVIGLEAIKQFKMAGEMPDAIFATSGAGSSFGGATFPFFEMKMEHSNMRLVAVEPTECPSFTEGTYQYDFVDSIGLAPQYKMYSLGRDFTPPSIHALGLGFHGQSPLSSHLYNLGHIEAVAVKQQDSLKAGVIFAKTEGILPSPESCYAIQAVIEHSLKCRSEKKADCIFLSIGGHGHFDLQAFGDALKIK